MGWRELTFRAQGPINMNKDTGCKSEMALGGSELSGFARMQGRFKKENGKVPWSDSVINIKCI